MRNGITGEFTSWPLILSLFPARIDTTCIHTHTHSHTYTRMYEPMRCDIFLSFGHRLVNYLSFLLQTNALILENSSLAKEKKLRGRYPHLSHTHTHIIYFPSVVAVGVWKSSQIFQPRLFLPEFHQSHLGWNEWGSVVVPARRTCLKGSHCSNPQIYSHLCASLFLL